MEIVAHDPVSLARQVTRKGLQIDLVQKRQELSEARLALLWGTDGGAAVRLVGNRGGPKRERAGQYGEQAPPASSHTQFTLFGDGAPPLILGPVDNGVLPQTPKRSSLRTLGERGTRRLCVLVQVRRWNIAAAHHLRLHTCIRAGLAPSNSVGNKCDRIPPVALLGTSSVGRALQHPQKPALHFFFRQTLCHQRLSRKPGKESYRLCKYRH